MADVSSPPDSVRPTRGDIGAGASLGPYELLTPIAQGGMAVVWAARLKGHKGFHKLVALKTMHKALTLDPLFERMFLAEAEFASRIDHPNVCAIRDLGEERGSLYLAMDWIDGETLASVESRHSAGLPIALAALIARDVALGLHGAHELESSRGEHLGLVHCDVSPQNILLTQDGVVKVVDFGLARATGAVAFTDKQVGGKMSFMSPEQAEGQPLDRRSDVFSLGIVLYRLITGRHPFEGETSLMRYRRMRDPNESVTLPDEIRPDCPASLALVVARALEKHPAERFQSMKDFARALESAVPEIRDPSARDELAAFAHKAVGAGVKKRRQKIEAAIEIARERVTEAEPEPVSLPSTVLEEIDEQRPALPTMRPIAFSLPPSARTRSARWLVVGGGVLVLSVSFWVWRANHSAKSAPVSGAPSLAAPPPASVDRPPPEAAVPIVAPAPTSSAKARARPRIRPTAPAPSASASAADSWRYDPGF